MNGHGARALRQSLRRRASLRAVKHLLATPTRHGGRATWHGIRLQMGMKTTPRRPNVALDHVSLPVRRLVPARKFYEAALGALGMTINMDVGDAFGMGSKKENGRSQCAAEGWVGARRAR